MYGKNPTRKQDLKKPLLWIQEIFPTVQGEGPATGRPATFIRLAGCNLKCYFCDTDFESGNIYADEYQILEEVIRVEPHPNAMVVLTGGEPLRQNILPLLNLLVKNRRVVHIETAGTLWIEGLQKIFLAGDTPGPESNTIVCSPKVSVVHKRLRPLVSAWKYIVSKEEGVDEETGLPVRSTQSIDGKHQVPHRFDPDTMRSRVYLQPCDTDDKAANAANIAFAAELCMRHGYTLSMQVHKVVGLP